MSKKRTQQITETVLRALSGRQGGGRFPLPREEIAALLENRHFADRVQVLLSEGRRPTWSLPGISSVRSPRRRRRGGSHLPTAMPAPASFRGRTTFLCGRRPRGRRPCCF